jgi:transposase InsO family protein
MESIYTNPKHPAAFGGRRALQKAGNFRMENVDKYLKSNKVYRKFKKNKTKFQRARITVSSIAHIFQADLMDIQKLSRKNQGYRFVLILVDCFSRYTIAKPLKRKDASNVAQALDESFAELQKRNLLAPTALLATDLGLEFWNSQVKNVLQRYSIHHYALKAPIKAGISEITGRYIMDRLYKYMYSEETDRWIDRLQDFVEAKNSRRNRRLANLAPKDINYDNQSKVFEVLYDDRYERQPTKPLPIGQKVQIAFDSLPFHKSYKGYFKDNVYEITNRNDYNGIYRYSLKDTADNMSVSGTYYFEELQPFFE